MLHKLKTLSKFYIEVVSGNKPFEVRKNDRDFQVGDILELIEVDNTNSLPTGRSSTFAVTYILSSKDFEGVKEGYVVMGIIERLSL